MTTEHETDLDGFGQLQAMLGDGLKAPMGETLRNSDINVARVRPRAGQDHRCAD